MLSDPFSFPLYNVKTAENKYIKMKIILYLLLGLTELEQYKLERDLSRDYYFPALDSKLYPAIGLDAFRVVSANLSIPYWKCWGG